MDTPQNRLRIMAGLVSLIVGLLILAMKFYVYALTRSTAIFSDALESVVNVVAAGFAVYAIREAQAPPDREHPYGHGKLEFVTAVFEGGLISFASLVIAFEAIRSLLHGGRIPNLDHGLGWIVLAGALNGLLGFFLVRMGKSTHSLALEADGQHVLTDFYSSLGVIVSLAFVKWFNLPWLDPLIALVMAVLLAGTGIPLVRRALGGLIDAADASLLEELRQGVEKHRFPGLIRIHHVRAMRNGRRIHVDGHVVVPEFWSVQEAHDKVEEWEDRVLEGRFHEGEIEFHLDPCRRVYCKQCELLDCTIRTEKFEGRTPHTIPELTSPVDITDRQKS